MRILGVVSSGRYQPPALTESWTSRIAGGAYPDVWNTVTYGNGTWIIGGENGRARSSTNGVTWTTRTSQFNLSNTSIYSSVYGNGVFLFGGGAGRASRSTDGATWSSVSVMAATSSRYSIYDIGYGNGVFLVNVVDMNTSSHIRKRSTDGITWTTVTPVFAGQIVDQTQSQMIYGNGIYLTSHGGGAEQSTDGITWTTVSGIPFNFFYTGVLGYGNGTYIITGAETSEVITSTNLTTWTSKNTSFVSSDRIFGDIVYGG